MPVPFVTTMRKAVYASRSGQSSVQPNVGFAVFTMPIADVDGETLPGETGTGVMRLAP